MPRFAITEKAGRVVAGRNNTGVGSVLVLSDDDAASAIEEGALVPLDGKKAKRATGKKTDGKKADGEKDNKPDDK